MLQELLLFTHNSRLFHRFTRSKEIDRELLVLLLLLCVKCLPQMLLCDINKCICTYIIYNVCVRAFVCARVCVTLDQLYKSSQVS